MKLFISILKRCLFSICLLASQLNAIGTVENPQNIAIIGSGYVGLVSGSGLAQMGHHVVCADVNKEKIDKLNNGILPIHEPKLDEFIERNCSAKRLFFTTNVGKAIQDSGIIIIAVDTPMNEAGDADLSALMSVAQALKENINNYKVICTKSTVPIGTNKILKAMLIEAIGSSENFDLVSNPEFLREGSALEDFFNRNPIVLGSDSAKALLIMENVYKPCIDNGTTLIKTDLTSAETIKYAWNAYSTIKICWVDQLSHLCNKVDADITTVVKGMSFSEKLLPMSTVKPGPGIGGSCFIKDTSALIAMCKKMGVDVGIVVAARQADKLHKEIIYNDFLGLLPDGQEKKKVAILGLSFKANTDDIRNSPAINIISQLLAAGVDVQAYDPKAMDNMKKLIPGAHYCASAEEALTGADGLLLISDWDEFKYMDLEHVSKIMAHPVIMDTRNMFNPGELTRLNFKFMNLGNKPLAI